MIAPRLQHDTGASSPVLAGACRVLSEHPDVARRTGPEPLEDLDGGRLAGAVGAEEADDLAAPDVELDAGKDLALAVAHPEVAHLDQRLARAVRAS
jgi:hypothetical protein